MAERGYSIITTAPLWKGQFLSAGNASTSDPVDLRASAELGIFSLNARVVAGTAGTVGTTVFTYTGASYLEGPYVTPSSAQSIGTCGTAGTANIFSFNPELMPFMKIIATQTGAGTAGKDSQIAAELNVQ